MTQAETLRNLKAFVMPAPGSSHITDAMEAGAAALENIERTLSITEEYKLRMEGLTIRRMSRALDSL